MDELDDNIRRTIEKYPVFEVGDRGKLRCMITGHELPARAELLSSYINTAKFIRAFRIHEIMEDYGDYFDDLGNGKCGCRITKKIVAKDPDDLKRHIEGRKFKVALEKTQLHDDNEHETSEESDAEMDESEILSRNRDDNSFLEDEDNEEIEEEYPEFMHDNDADDDNYDFSIMDTEKDAELNNRKRKAENTSKLKKKKRN